MTASKPLKLAASCLAALLTRTGDTDAAARLYDATLPLVHAAEYRRLEAYARIGMAENVMAKGDLAAARAHAEAARPLLAAGNWSPGYRLKLLDVAIIRKQGDLQAAERMLATLDRAAHEHDDVLAQVLARSGLRGATLDWLMPSLE